MTDPTTPKPMVKITMEDAITLRNEMREVNKGMGKILGHILMKPFAAGHEGDKKETFEQAIDNANALIDRLTIAIHEAGKG